MVPRILPFCGSARTAPHNKVFLEGVKAALTADAAFREGWYDEPPTRGLRAASRVYAGWGFSQAFYMQERWRELGHTSLEDFLVRFWEGFFLDERDANNLLTMLWTWQNGDIGLTEGFDGSFERALGSIQARAIVMPAEKDLYFPAGGQRVRGRAHAQRGAARDPGRLGPFRGRRREPDRHGVHRCRAQGAPGELSAGCEHEGAGHPPPAGAQP
jgi:homoserine O-acetyltransferase